ncbi:uncharacterized protein FFFS_15721 [Fusarium fujikuroi]|nr:uncharacterized protein FFFS_15721 [Fusarium fujikuroi]
MSSPTDEQGENQQNAVVATSPHVIVESDKGKLCPRYYHAGAFFWPDLWPWRTPSSMQHTGIYLYLPQQLAPQTLESGNLGEPDDSEQRLSHLLACEGIDDATIPRAYRDAIQIAITYEIR